MLLDNNQIQHLMFQNESEEWRKDKEDADTRRAIFFVRHYVVGLYLKIVFMFSS